MSLGVGSLSGQTNPQGQGKEEGLGQWGWEVGLPHLELAEEDRMTHATRFVRLQILLIMNLIDTFVYSATRKVIGPAVGLYIRL